MRREIRSFFRQHQILTRLIALGFILCSLYINYNVIEGAINVYKHLQRKEGVIDMWYSTSMKTTKACLKIEGDTTVYTTSRPGWWMTLQHNGKRGEKVLFYTLDSKHNSMTKYPNRYFGLSESNSPRSSFWVFLDVVFYSYKKVFLIFLLSIIGLVLFNGSIVENRIIKFISISLAFLSIMFWGIASIS